ncbi:hypothetical protein [Gordonia sp. 852002-50395_SCH5434458]|uniref:hypothetical protein n=1 Tax=Gordonia sp. 852002-50395_SCH5434458 TaxID=1834090 RepID=UPI0009EEEFA0|nr:hypothetical protein [Gordonia sp. 852002-50395_SCH5434458]
MESIARKYSEELKERATRMAFEARRDPDSARGAINRIGDQFGVNRRLYELGVVRPESMAVCGAGTLDKRR